MIQAAIFDMDGLLIDSEPFWRQSHREVVAAHGYEISEDDIRAMAGKRTDEVVRSWFDRFQWESPSAEEMEAEIVNKVIEHITINGQSLPGVQKVIAVLESQQIVLAVASSSSPPVIEAVLNKLGLSKHMKFAHSAVHEEFGKPHPAVFLTTAEQLNVSPTDCLVFEDSLNGVRAAKAAGMKCIAVPEQENQNKPDFNEADLVVNSLADVSWSDIQNLFA